MGYTGSPLRTALVAIAAADSTKAIIAAPATGSRIRVFRARYISKTSAAQAMTLADGATNILDLAASVTAHAVIDTGFLPSGIPLAAATALTATPAAAGPAGTFYVQYTVEQV